MTTSARSVFEENAEETVRFSQRVKQITMSAIKQMPILASKVGGCVSLGQGIPSFGTPDFIRDAIIKELSENDAIGKYSIQPGVPALIQALAEDLRRSKKAQIDDPQSELFISCGGMEALAAAMTVIVERGDEVILPTPTYSSHIEQILFAEGVPRFVPALEHDNWRLDIDGFRKAITPKTKAIVLCNPVNPTGAVFPESDMRAIAQLVVEKDIYLILDEAYDFLLYDETPYFSLLSIPELKKHLISCGSFSKRFCMTGWRVGYMLAPPAVIRQGLKVHDAFAICAPTISQYAALAALRATNGKDGQGDRFVAKLIATLQSRRELVCERLDRLAHVFSYTKPKGGYYVFPKYEGEDASVDFAVRILNEARVITIPGGAFGPAGEHHIRISFGGAEAELNESFDRLDRFFKA
ncbi:MAG TPA: pyridoxal phosphate-dependent aminotransferase [Planktothrix sp.]|jgi:aminotransferase